MGRIAGQLDLQRVHSIGNAVGVLARLAVSGPRRLYTRRMLAQACTMNARRQMQSTGRQRSYIHHMPCHTHRYYRRNPARLHSYCHHMLTIPAQANHRHQKVPRDRPQEGCHLSVTPEPSRAPANSPSRADQEDCDPPLKGHHQVQERQGPISHQVQDPLLPLPLHPDR